MSASGSVARRAIAVFAITVSAAIGFSLLSSSAATGSGAPFLTQAQADQRYVQRYWANVTATGDVLESSLPSATARWISLGRYEVDFGGLDVDKCAAVASIGESYAGEGGELRGVRGEIIAITQASRVFVSTYDSDGSREDHFFSLQVLC